MSERTDGVNHRAKTYAMQAWDWKDDPAPPIRALFQYFGISPDLDGLDPESPEVLLSVLSREHNLSLYEAPGLEGSDAHGYILSSEILRTGRKRG